MLLKNVICTLTALSFMSVSGGAMAQNIQYRDILNPETGMVSASVPLPASWSLITNPNSDLSLSGPNGVKVYKPEKHEFYFSEKPQLLRQSTISQNFSNRTFAQPISIEHFFERAVKPSLESSGLTLVATYPFPEDSEFRDKVVRSTPDNRLIMRHNTLASDWTTRDGKKFMVALAGRYIETSQQHGFPGLLSFWSMEVTQMEAPVAHFDNAKQVLINAKKHTRIGQENAQHQNQIIKANNARDDAHWDRMAAQSRVGHQQRMRDIEAFGQSSRDWAATSQGILDSSHAAFQGREALQSAGQANLVRSIHGQTVIGNSYPYGGQIVQGGYEHYWVNQNGEYIPSNDGFYNPNQDSSVNSEDWTRTEERR